MILNKLTLKNYKKYRDETIEFYDGTTGIFGQNGVGKTSIVEAILFALYGVKNTSVNNNFIATSESNDFAYVTLEFSIDNDIYMIERKFKRGNKKNVHKAKLFRNGVVFIDGTTQIEAELEKIIGVAINDFETTVYSGQDELMRIVKYTPAERKKWLTKVFHIDFLKKEAEEELMKREKDVEVELLKFNVLSDTADLEKLSWDKHDYEMKISENDKSIVAFNSELAECDYKIKNNEDVIKKISSVKSSIKDNENDVKLIEQSISSVDNNIFNINQKLNEISEAKIKISEYGNIEEKVIEINKKYTLFVDKYNEYLHVVDKCNSVDDNISTNYKFLGKLNEEIKEIEQKEKEILEYADYIFEREKKQGELKDIERKDELYRDITSHINAIDGEFKHLNDKQNDVNESIEDKNEKVARRNELDEILIDLGVYRDRDENLSKLSSYVERRNAINNDINSRGTKIEQLHKNIVVIDEMVKSEDGLRKKSDVYLKNIKNLTNGNSELTYKITECEADIKETESFLDELVRHGSDSKCPFCGKILGIEYELLLKDSETKVKELNEKIDSNTLEVDRNNSQINEFTDLNGIITSKLENITHEKIRYEEYSKSIEEYNDEIGKFNNDLKAVESKINLLSEGNDYDKVEHRRVKSRLSELYDVKSEYDGICATIKNYEKEDLYNKLKSIESQIKNLDFDRSKYQTELNTLDYDSEVKDVIVERIAFLNIKYEEYLGLKMYIENKTGVEEKICEYNDIINSLISTRDSYNKQLVGLKNDGYTKDAIIEIESIKMELDIKYQMYRELDLCIAQEEKIEDDKDGLLSEKNAMHAKKTSAVDNVDKLKCALCEFNSEEDYLSKIADIRVLKDKVYNNLSGETSVKGLNQKELHDICNKISEIKKYEEDIKELNTKLTLIKQTRRYIGLYIMHILKTIRNNIEDDASYMISEITDGKYTSIKLDENFDIYLEDCGEYYTIDRFSGGEKDNVALSLRIALSHYLMQMSSSNDSTFLVFDEIFGSQDEIRRNNLLKSLKIQEKYFPQIFVITHMDNIDDAFTNSLQIEEDDDGSHASYV